jgi:hypothetical protein
MGSMGGMGNIFHGNIEIKKLSEWLLAVKKEVWHSLSSKQEHTPPLVACRCGCGCT